MWDVESFFKIQMHRANQLILINMLVATLKNSSVKLTPPGLMRVSRPVSGLRRAQSPSVHSKGYSLSYMCSICWIWDSLYIKLVGWTQHCIQHRGSGGQAACSALPDWPGMLNPVHIGSLEPWVSSMLNAACGLD